MWVIYNLSLNQFILKFPGVQCYDCVCLLGKETVTGANSSGMSQPHSIVVSGFGEQSFVFVWR